jgi:hypothetical protein
VSAAEEGKRPRGTFLIVLGVVASLIAVLLLLMGLGLILIHGSARDEDGYFSSDTATVASSGYAVTTDKIDLGTDTDWVPEKVLGDLRLRATGAGGKPVFIGIGPSDGVARYLDGVARSELTDIDGNGDPVLAERAGGRPSRPPGAVGVWTARAAGPGEREVVWDPEPGSWTAVVMNVDGARGVTADVSVGMKVGWVLWVGIVLGVAGLIAGGLGGLAIVRGSRRRTARREAEAATRGG